MTKQSENWRPEFGMINYLLFAAGLVILGIGFYILSLGSQDGFQSRTLAPMILFFAFVVVFPLAIWVKKPGKS